MRNMPRKVANKKDWCPNQRDVLTSIRYERVYTKTSGISFCDMSENDPEYSIVWNSGFRVGCSNTDGGRRNLDTHGVKNGHNYWARRKNVFCETKGYMLENGYTKVRRTSHRYYSDDSGLQPLRQGRMG